VAFSWESELSLISFLSLTSIHFSFRICLAAHDAFRTLRDLNSSPGLKYAPETPARNNWDDFEVETCNNGRPRRTEKEMDKSELATS